MVMDQRQWLSMTVTFKVLRNGTQNDFCDVIHQSLIAPVTELQNNRQHVVGSCLHQNRANNNNTQQEVGERPTPPNHKPTRQQETH